jgi:hypothetical protein
VPEMGRSRPEMREMVAGNGGPRSAVEMESSVGARRWKLGRRWKTARDGERTVTFGRRCRTHSGGLVSDRRWRTHGGDEERRWREGGKDLGGKMVWRRKLV